MTQPLAPVPRRPPSTVMRLDRLGSLHQCRLSFMRGLTRRMARESWAFSRPVFAVDDKGVGHAVYSVDTGQRVYSLVAFAHDLPADQRSDRVIAEAWDATFALFDGTPTTDDIARLAENVPLQEAGRITARELSLSRANRSVRLWEHVVSRLADGQQPDRATLDGVGYLMRTTAVYGSGKFGAADRDDISDRPEMAAPFQAEMLSVYFIRTFVRDLIDHMAKTRSGDRAARLDRSVAETLGIGNSTGLGMAPFLINHPILFNNWIAAREDALARVRSIDRATADEIAAFRCVFEAARMDIRGWHSAHAIQQEKLLALNNDLHLLAQQVATLNTDQHRPWDRLFTWAESHLSLEGQEFLTSLLLEPYGALVDDLATTMSDTCSDAFLIDGSMTVADVIALIDIPFGWVRDMDWTDPVTCARAWYVSEEKLEPRLGERFEEPIAEFEQPLSPARDAARARADLAKFPAAEPIAAFLSRHPEHRHTVRRAQMSRRAPYGEIRDNTIGADLMPIDLLRAKLSFFGATRFDPRSDRWVRICMFAGCPYPEDLNAENADQWVYGNPVP